MSKVDDWKRPDGSLFMNAYYYSFEPTRYEPVDRVLSAVAIAGKWAHHTDAWTDHTPGCWSPVETIQQEATRCADAAADMAHKLAAYERVVEAAREFVYRDSEAFGRLRAALDALTGCATD